MDPLPLFDNGILMNISEAAHLVSGQVIGADVEFQNVTNDTRKLKKKSLYVALTGERFDGHTFIEKARIEGASAALVERIIEDPLPQIIVNNTRSALGKLSLAWRTRFTGPLIALTGSNGKTTVKEMIRSILATQYPTLATFGNLNNDIGVPLTLLRLSPNYHQAAVIELGANHPGEIAYLSTLTRPTVALVNNAGPAHLEGFGSVEGVARAKGEIYDGLSGIAVINADDPYAKLWHRLAKDLPKITFGLNQPATISATDLKTLGEAKGYQCLLHFNHRSASMIVPLPGRHNVLNALAAAAATIAIGISLDAVVLGLKKMEGIHGRLRPCLGFHGSQIIDDTYNANPASLRAAIEVLSSFSGKRILVLGDMGELGPTTLTHHAEIGILARTLGIDAIFTCGELSREASSKFGLGASHYTDIESLVIALKKILKQGVIVLIKGSRSAGMERAVHQLI